jgi:hypothetical protein
MTGLAEQLAVAVAMPGLTDAPHVPGVLFTEIFTGQVITGFSTLLTVTENWQIKLVLLDASVKE